VDQKNWVTPARRGKTETVMTRRWLTAFGVVALLAGLGVGGTLAQVPPEVREVRRQINVEDKSENIHDPDSKIWVLDFRFRAPRLMTVDVPGRGRKICWYMWYQVWNRTKEPRTFNPRFELVTLDKPGVHVDEVLPSVQEAIRKIEDPLGHMDIKNSVSIGKEPIPPSKPDATPKAITGVAVWTDVNPDATQFSIFVTGLSNGWSLAEIPPDNKQVVRRKSLQLNFRKLGDRFYQHSGEIRFLPPEQWLYRASSLKMADGGKAPAKSEPAKDGNAGTPTLPERTLSGKTPPDR
jgi:hypothetical protein